MSKNFMIHLWGGFFNDEHRAKHKIEPGYYWFETNEARHQRLKELQGIETDLKARMLAFTIADGPDTRKRVTASMVLTFNGEDIPLEYDFGFGYPEESAEYMFNDGNYACDCNRSFFIGRKKEGFPELECWDEIKMKDFKVVLSEPTVRDFEPRS